MREKAVVQSARELASIIDRLHDRWFDLDDIRFDKPSATVTIPFSQDRVQLVIHDANDLRVDDSENIGTYDFNTITYEPEYRRLSVLTGVPLKLEIEVDTLLVSLAPM